MTLKLNPLSKSRQKQSKLPWRLLIVGLLFLGWLVFFWNLGSIGLIDETEPLFAEASRQMIETGDWITPYYNGVTRFDKPPLLYWGQAVSYLAIGVNEWAVRLPSALSAIALSALGFYTLRQFGYPTPKLAQESHTEAKTRSLRQQHQLWLSAGLGSLLMALNPITIGWGRTGVSDMLLTACTAGALLAFFIGYATENPNVKVPWYWAFYLLIGLAILTKGPVGIVLPGLILGAFLLYVGKFGEVVAEMQLLPGILIVLAVSVPWYIIATWENGKAFIDSFFGYHNVERFTNVVNYHDGPWYFYFLVVLLGFAPWALYLPVAIARTRFWKLDNWRNQPRYTHLGVFALFWFAIIFVFFSIAVTKRANYILPLIPAAGILVALLWSEELTVKRQNKTFSVFYRASVILNLIFLLVVAAALFLITRIVGYDPEVPTLLPLLEQSGLPILGGIIWTVTAVAIAVLALKRRWNWVWSANIIGLIAFFVLIVNPAASLVDRVRHEPLRELSAIATQVAQPNEPLVFIGFEKPSVVFYTQKQVHFFDSGELAKPYLENSATIESNPSSWLILSQTQILQSTGLQPQQYQNLGSAGTYQLVRLSQRTLN